MPIDAATKQKIIQEHKRHEKDSGSPEIQIAVLTKDITELTGHMQKHRKDHASRHGLLLKVNRRNKLLAYLKRADRAKYTQLTEKLGLRT
jgi:small subunit ribosomal protein S15